MATVKEVIKFLKALNEDEELFIGYSDEEEGRCYLWTDKAIIDKARELTGNKICRVDTAITNLYEDDEDYHYSLVDLD